MYWCFAGLSVNPLKECARKFHRHSPLPWSYINLWLQTNRKIHYANCYLISQTIDRKSRKLPIIRRWCTKWTLKYSLPLCCLFLTKFRCSLTIEIVSCFNWNGHLFALTSLVPKTTRHGNTKSWMHNESILQKKNVLLLHLCLCVIRPSLSIDCVKCVWKKAWIKYLI